MPMRVQIVDNQSVVRRGLTMFLMTDPDIVIVGESTNGREAVNMSQQLQPDVILMDLLLPEMSGVAAAKIIREQQPHIHMIALSSSTDSGLIASAILAGVNTYVHKGNQPTQLLTTIQGVAAGRVMLPPNLRQRVLNELPSPPAPEPLTRLELAILNLLAAAHSDDEIAETLQLTREVVQNAVQHVQAQLSASTRLLAVLRATQSGLLEPEAAP